MKESLYFVGIDVDDKAYHFSVVSPEGDTIAKGIRCKRDVGFLLKKLTNIIKKEKFVVGYEATYLGYSLYRKLKKHNIACKVIAPSSIAKAPQDRVKNDRIDSMRLALGLFRDEFSYVQPPSLDQESNRMLTRTRTFLVKQKSDMKRHILSQCRLLDLDYKQETSARSYWTFAHRGWLDKKITELSSSSHLTLASLLQILENLERQIDSLDLEIKNLSTTLEYKKQAEALTCFKGISTTTAMIILTEIFDIKRFDHPKKLVGYVGLDIAEYSSGGKQIQYGITKMGNRRLRTALVEACQKFSTSKSLSKRKQALRKGFDPKIIAIADRCQDRLYKKGHRLLAREKPRNKVKVACAREMIGFLWEAMSKAA